MTAALMKDGDPDEKKNWKGRRKRKVFKEMTMVMMVMMITNRDYDLISFGRQILIKLINDILH